jgi:hypothetical protein
LVGFTCTKGSSFVRLSNHGYGQVSEENQVSFTSESEAEPAGYRKAGNCKQLLLVEIRSRETEANA